MSLEPAMALDQTTKPLLLTLGQLKLSSSVFKQDKPLLLVAYLSLEGPRPRKFMAELFWPGATNPMNSLAVALKKLREAGIAEADTVRVWATLECDAQTLREHLRSGRWGEAVALYAGSFADGVATEEIGEELEEWLYSTREALAGEVRSALLTLAEHEAAGGRFTEAAARAEAAYRMPGVAPLEAEELIRLYRLLLAAEHPLKETLEREAKELEIGLATSAEVARGKLRQTLIGRRRELETLLALEPGEWAWVRGGDGMGKTALLRELESKSGWRYLPARSGLPFATLEPLLRDLEGGEEAVLRRLARSSESLLVDGWSDCDPESRQVLVRLRNLRPALRIVISDEGEPPFAPEELMELGPLSTAELQPFAGAMEATDGLPALVEAWLRGEPVKVALETRLLSLSPEARTLFIALALQDKPDLPLVRKGLGWVPSMFMKSLDALMVAGLVEASGRVRVGSSVLGYLEARPNEVQTIALQLARTLAPLQAYPLYQKSRTIWEEADLVRVKQAYLAWAEALLHRGFPAQAVEALTHAPMDDEVQLTKADILLRANRFGDVLVTLKGLPESPRYFAIQGEALYRLGKQEEARRAANEAFKGSTADKAQAQHILAKIALSSRQFEEAEKLFQRAGTLWAAIGRHYRWAEALNGQAVAKSLYSGHAEEVFKEALKEAGDNTQARALILTNLGRGYMREKNWDEANKCFQEALNLAVNVGALYIVSLAWNQIGVMHDRRNQRTEAKQAFLKALEFAHKTGDQEAIGRLMANMAEVSNDMEAWQDAIIFLESVGFHSAVASIRANAQGFVARSQTQV